MTNLELFMALGNISSENLSGAEELQNKPCVRTNHKMQMKRAVLIAAVIALTLLLVGCAVVYVLRMQDVKIGEATETRDYRLVDGTYVEDPHEVNQNVLTLAGLKGTKAYQACADFYTFKEEYTQNMEAMMNNGTLPEDFFENDTYGKAMNAKASELAAQYGLKPEGESLNFRTTRNMCDALGIERLVKQFEEISARASGGSCYNTGNLFCTISFQNQVIDSSDNQGSFLVYNPVFRVIRVLDVPVRRRPHGFPSVALNLVADTALLADVPGVPLIKKVTDRG